MGHVILVQEGPCQARAARGDSGRFMCNPQVWLVQGSVRMAKGPVQLLFSNFSAVSSEYENSKC